MEITELRTAQRWVAAEPLPGSFGSASVSIVNFGEEGVQIEHAQPLRLATRSRLAIRRGDSIITVTGTVIWSRLSRSTDSRGKLLYRSGLHLDGELDPFNMVIHYLATRGMLEEDHDSLARKRARVEQKESTRTTQPALKLMPQETVSPEQELLIDHARDRMSVNQLEAKQRSQHARFALGEELAKRYPDEVLAVWDYLERSVDLTKIVRVFHR